MRVSRKLRRFLALALALAVICTGVGNDIRVSRAEAREAEQAESPEKAGPEGSAEEAPKESGAEESAEEAPKESGAEESAGEASKESVPEGSAGEVPKESVPKESAGEAPKESVPKEAAGEALKDADLEGTMEEMLKETALEESAGEGPKETEPKESEEEGPKESTSKESAEETPKESAPKESVEEALKESGPEKPVEEGPKETGPKETMEEVPEKIEPTESAGEASKESAPQELSGIRLFAAAAERDEGLSMAAAEAETETSYPIYVSTPNVTIQKEAGSDVLYVGNIRLSAVEAASGDTVSTQHRSMMSIRCSKCSAMVYTELPMTYADVSVSYSDPSIIGEHTYKASHWTTDDKGRDSGCLQLDSEVLRPGSTDVEILYSLLFTNFRNDKGKCPLCGGWMPRRGNDSRWYRYKGSYRINVYVDYTLRYDANADGAEVENMPEPGTRRVYADTAELSITEQEPYRYGYRFLGWAEKKYAGERDYRPSEKVTLNWTEGTRAEKTLYAVWERIETGGRPGEIVPVQPEEPDPPEPEEPDLNFIKKACGTDAVTPVTWVETGREYCYVVTVKNQTKHEIENLSVSEVLDPDLIQLLKIPPDYENGTWKIGRLDAEETAVLVLPVKALKAHPAYENTIHLWIQDADGKDTEILPGPDDQPTAVVEIRAAEDPPPEEPDPPTEDPKPPAEDPEPPVEDPDDPNPTPDPPSNPSPTPGPDPEPPVNPSPPAPVLIPPSPAPAVPAFQPAVREETEERIVSAEEPPAPAAKPSEKKPASPDKTVETKDPRTPLAGRGHLCCILHFVILLLALLTELFYMRSMKKHQSKIFGLRRELADGEL